MQIKVAKNLDDFTDALFESAERITREYEPTGLQEDIILAVGCGRYKIVVAFDANRVGKTTTIVNIAKNIFWPCDEKWFGFWAGDSVFRSWPFPEKSFRFTGTPTNCADNGAIQGEIAKWWPKGRYTQDKAGKHHYSAISTDTGWSGDVLTYEQAADEFEGKTLSLVLSDEPPKPTLFGSIASRLMQGIWIIGATPVDCGILVDMIDEIKERGSPVIIVSGSILENHIETGKPNHLGTKRGLWTTQEIEQYSATIPQEERAARLEGKHNNKSGKIYPQFDLAVNDERVQKVNWQIGILDYFNCYMSCDVHSKAYPMLYWYAVSPGNDVFVYNEWPRRADTGGLYYDEIRNSWQWSKTVEEFAAIIKTNDWSEYGADVINRAIDPMFAADNPTFLSKMAQAGVSGFTVPPVERIETQRHELQTMLSFDHVAPLHEFNRPTWYFASHCENAKRGIIRHYWDIDRVNKKAKESEQYKDMVDPHRYRLAAWNGQPRYDVTKTRQFRVSEAARLAGKSESRTREEFYQGIPVFHGTQGI